MTLYFDVLQGTTYFFGVLVIIGLWLIVRWVWNTFL